MARRLAEPHRSQRRAWLITGPLGLIAVGCTVGLASAHPNSFGEWPLGLVFFGLFIAADAAVLHFVVRRQGFSVTINEIPLILALFYLPPVTLLLVRGLGSLVVQLRRKSPPTKLWFNVASALAATSLASVVLFTVGPTPLQGVGPTTWLELFAAGSTNLVVTLAAVIGVITLVQGLPAGQETARTGLPGVVTAAINMTVGLIVLIVLHTTLWTVLLLAGLAGVLVLVYRSYAQFMTQHKTLTDMYELTRKIGETGHDGALADVLLTRVRQLMQAEYATLWLPALGRHPEVLLTAKFDNHGLLDVVATPDTLRKRAVEEGRTIAVGLRQSGLPDIEFLDQLRERGTKDAIIVPLRSGTAVIGCLEVAGRLGDLYHFRAIDVRVLETIAAHAAVALENSRLVDRLRFDAYHDALTGLPNRRRMLASLEEAVKVRAPGEVVAVMLFDVDGLRDVNDSLGHTAGDKLLAEVARRLRDQAPPAALVGRCGGDEFAVTLRTENAETAAVLAAELRSALQEPMEFGTLTLDVDTAVGVAVHPDHGSDAAMLLQRADVATHAAKVVPAAVQLFNLGLESRSARRLGLAGELRRALDADELEVFFQPLVSLRDRRLVGVECLARWEHPAHGSVSPEDFVAVAEHTGQLSKLTEAVLKEGLRRCRQWADVGRPLTVAVNLSPRTLVDPEFPNRVAELLTEYGVAPERLTLEITEDGVVGETDRPMPTLRRLHEIGVRLAVDDFGTGYSSLSYLRRLPVHEVKVDRSFVQGMATDPGDLAIVRAVVDLSRHFGLTVVAEGVESELTLNLLEEMGCDIGQGFLFSRPLPYERLEAWFGAQTEAEPTPTGEVRRLRAVP